MADILAELILLPLMTTPIPKLETLNLSVSFNSDGTAVYTVAPIFLVTHLAAIAYDALQAIVVGIASGVVSMFG